MARYYIRKDRKREREKKKGGEGGSLFSGSPSSDTIVGHAPFLFTIGPSSCSGACHWLQLKDWAMRSLRAQGGTKFTWTFSVGTGASYRRYEQVETNPAATPSHFQ